MFPSIIKKNHEICVDGSSSLFSPYSPSETNSNLESMRRLFTEGPRPKEADIITKMMSYSKDMESKQMLRWCLDPHNKCVGRVLQLNFRQISVLIKV